MQDAQSIVDKTKFAVKGSTTANHGENGDRRYEAGFLESSHASSSTRNAPSVGGHASLETVEEYWRKTISARSDPFTVRLGYNTLSAFESACKVVCSLVAEATFRQDGQIVTFTVLSREVALSVSDKTVDEYSKVRSLALMLVAAGYRGDMVRMVTGLRDIHAPAEYKKTAVEQQFELIAISYVELAVSYLPGHWYDNVFGSEGRESHTGGLHEVYFLTGLVKDSNASASDYSAVVARLHAIRTGKFVGPDADVEPFDHSKFLMSEYDYSLYRQMLEGSDSRSDGVNAVASQLSSVHISSDVTAMSVCVFTGRVSRVLGVECKPIPSLDWHCAMTDAGNLRSDLRSRRQVMAMAGDHLLKAFVAMDHVRSGVLPEVLSGVLTRKHSNSAMSQKFAASPFASFVTCAAAVSISSGKVGADFLEAIAYMVYATAGKKGIVAYINTLDMGSDV